VNTASVNCGRQQLRPKRDTSLGHFYLVIHLRATDAGKSLAPGGTVSGLVHLPAFIEPPHMIDKLVAVTQHSFGLSHITRHNGIALPARLRFRLHESRVAIHPTGSHIEKIWPRKKFIALAKKLTQQGLNPSRCTCRIPKRLNRSNRKRQTPTRCGFSDAPLDIWDKPKGPERVRNPAIPLAVLVAASRETPGTDATSIKSGTWPVMKAIGGRSRL
jgi:hypothetical protein